MIFFRKVVSTLRGPALAAYRFERHGKIARFELRWVDNDLHAGHLRMRRMLPSSIESYFVIAFSYG